MAELQQQYLKAMGIDVWIRRDLPAVEAPQQKQQPVIASHNNISSATALDSDSPSQATFDVTTKGWDALRSAVTACEQCALHTTRTQTVFGVGDRQANWLIVGEAPGADEDRQGEPFVGRAGQLLNEMLCAIGLQREQVYIANILKCRPPHNRDPQADEMNHCNAYLQRQIALLQPAVIVAVGRIAAQNLLKSDQRIGVLRGRNHLYSGKYSGSDIPLVATYHPAYLLRSPLEKRKVWQDLQRARDIVAEKLKDGSVD